MYLIIKATEAKPLEGILKIKIIMYLIIKPLCLFILSH